MRAKGWIIVSLALLILEGGGGHRKALAAQDSAHSQASEPSRQQEMPGMDMGHDGSVGMDMHHHAPSGNTPDDDQRTQADAMHSMQPGHHMTGPHMRMTPPRQASPEDWARAIRIAATLRQAIAKYEDYRLALADGYRIFLPNVPQPEYHFTNYWNGYLEDFTFDPARPTSLLYRKTAKGWELIGAMYTAARGATLQQLNERVPLGVARWHAHTNLCLPKRGEKADWKRFGLTGSIATEKECAEAGGIYYPQVFGWMVHVYPFESTPAKMFAQ